MSKEFIDKLLAGSRILHQMQVDVDQTVRILLGLIQKDTCWKDRLQLHGGIFAFKGGRWEMTTIRRDKPCVRLIQDCSGKLFVRYATDTRYATHRLGILAHQLYSQKITYAAEWLPELTRQLLEVFPQLESDAKEIIAAAT